MRVRISTCPVSTLIRRCILAIATLAVIGVPSTAMAGDKKATPVAADTKLPLTAALVLTHQFCHATIGVIDTGLNAFGFGHFACKELEPAIKGYFSNLVLVHEVPSPGTAQIVLEPRLLLAYGRFTDKEGEMQLQWTVKDQSGNSVWNGDVKTRAKRKFGMNSIAGYHTLQDEVKDLVAESGLAISSAPEMRTFAQLQLAKSNPANASVQTAASSNVPRQAIDGKLPLNAALVLTPAFCETKWGVEDRLPLELGKRVCEDLPSRLKSLFTSVTVVQDTPAPGVAQIVLQPRFPDAVQASRPFFSGTRKHATVSLEWKVADCSTKPVWIGNVQGEVKHPIGSLVGAWPHAMEEAAEDLAQLSGSAIPSAPEVRRLVQLELAKSGSANSPANLAGSAELFKTIEEKDLAKVAALLKDHPGLASAPNPNADTPLHLAASSGDTSLAELLLANQADVNAKDANGATPLHNAASAGRKEVAERLIGYHADVNAKDFKNVTPLHKAADQGHADIANLLLDSHADPNAKDSGRKAPLYLAASAGHTGVVESLLAHQASVDVKGDKDITPLHAAIKNEHLDVTRLLVAAHADVNAKQSDGTTPLHLAAQDGLKEIAALLLNSKTDVNSKDAKGNAPLFLAARAGHSDVATLLLAAHADANAKCENGETALFWAANHGDQQLVESLLTNHADVNARDASGGTPLHVAASEGRKEIAETFLARNAEINAQNRSGVTPLHNAVKKGHQDVAELLRTHGGVDFAGWAWPDAESIGPPHKIILLPVIDSRTDTHDKVDLENLRKVARKDLGKKKYEVIEADAVPAGERWAITLSLLNTGGRGIYSAAAVSCLLKDQQTGLAQWEGGAVGGRQTTLSESSAVTPEEFQRMGGGLQAAATLQTMQTADILLATIMPGSARKNAIDNAVRAATQNIPDLHKKKKRSDMKRGRGRSESRSPIFVAFGASG